MKAVLISAGATRNPIDAVRFISARSSGRTGLAVAAGLRERGARVHVLGSPEVAARAGADAEIEIYGDTWDLMARMERWIRAHPQAAVVHAAAVGDYAIADAESSKIPSGQDELVLRLTPTPKIADAVRGWGLAGPFVTFKAAAPETADPDLVAIASRQLHRTGSDLVFANVLGRIGLRVALVSAGGVEWFEDRDDGVRALVDFVDQASAGDGA